MRNCTVCDQRLPSEETYFCPNCGSALVQNKLITERTTLNYDPLSMYFKPWKEKVNLPKRNHNNSGNGKNSGSMKQPWIPTMRQLRVVKPSATQLEKKLMQKTDFFCDDLKISNNKKNKRMKIVFTSVLDLLRVSEIPEMKDGVSKSVLDKAWTKQTLLDQIVIKRLGINHTVVSV